MAAPFDLETVLIRWNGAEGFTLGDATTGVAVFGATGSGKTSGPGALLAKAYLKAGMGGLVLCSKVEERQQWEAWARATGRSADIVPVDTGNRARFNFLDWEAGRAGEGGGLTINIVALLDAIAGVFAQGDAGSGEGGGDNQFFRSALRHMLSNLVDLPLLASLPVSLPLMRLIAASAPLSLAQRDNPDWQKGSACWRILREADEATNDDPARWTDYEECRSYWEIDFPTLSDRTRSVITLMFSMMARAFVTRPLRTLFSEDTTIRPEDAFDGKIIIVDLPAQSFYEVGRAAALAWKHCFQQAVMRRAYSPRNRPVFLWADEAQNFITEKDAEYQAVARSAGGCTVYLTQQREGIRRVLKSDDATENLINNLQTIFACQNNGQSNEWLSARIGSRYVKIATTNIGRSGPGGATDFLAEAGGQAGVSRTEQKRAFIEPARFTTLKRGGPQNQGHVEAVVYCGGKLFAQSDGGEPLPYKILTFRQPERTAT